MKNGQRILALDASTTAVGWCVADGTEYVCSGVFVPDKNGDWYERVYAIECWVGNTLLGDQDIELVVQEWPTGNKKNMRTNVLLGTPMYAARRAVKETSGVREWMSVTASQVRGSGYHKKAIWAAEALIRDATKGKRGLASKGKYREDEADAIGVWRAWVKKRGYQ